MREWILRLLGYGLVAGYRIGHSCWKVIWVDEWFSLGWQLGSSLRVRLVEKMRGRSVSPQVRADRSASPHKIKKKNLYLCILITSFMDSCINISNFCITGKDKYYVIFNVLKFKEYIVYVIVWIWWKCWIINLSSNSSKSLLNFVNFLNFLNF